MKRCIDIVMYCIYVYLMSYRAGSGLLIHGVLGCVLFVLFIVHHLLNIRWYQAIPKGKYNAKRAFLLLIDCALFICMVGMAISSMLLSRDVFNTSIFPTMQYAKELHILSTSWGFFIMMIHVGLHMYVPIEKTNKICMQSRFAYSYVLLFVCFMGYGMYCLYASNLIQGMFLLHKTNVNMTLFIAQYVCMTIAFSQVIYMYQKWKIRYGKKNVFK